MGTDACIPSSFMPMVSTDELLSLGHIPEKHDHRLTSMRSEDNEGPGEAQRNRDYVDLRVRPINRGTLVVGTVAARTR